MCVRDESGGWQYWENPWPDHHNLEHSTTPPFSIRPSFLPQMGLYHLSVLVTMSIFQLKSIPLPCEVKGGWTSEGMISSSSIVVQRGGGDQPASGWTLRLLAGSGERSPVSPSLACRHRSRGAVTRSHREARIPVLMIPASLPGEKYLCA